MAKIGTLSESITNHINNEIMKPVSFKEQNVVYAKDQPEYLPLPAYKVDEPEGRVISCWKLSMFERLRLLITGKLWVSLMSFNKPLTPSYFTTKKADMFGSERQAKNTIKEAVRLFYDLRKKHA